VISYEVSHEQIKASPTTPFPHTVLIYGKCRHDTAHISGTRAAGSRPFLVLYCPKTPCPVSQPPSDGTRGKRRGGCGKAGQGGLGDKFEPVTPCSRQHAGKTLHHSLVGDKKVWLVADSWDLSMDLLSFCCAMRVCARERSNGRGLPHHPTPPALDGRMVDPPTHMQPYESRFF